jgi:hypothetical protein
VSRSWSSGGDQTPRVRVRGRSSRRGRAPRRQIRCAGRARCECARWDDGGREPVVMVVTEATVMMVVVAAAAAAVMMVETAVMATVTAPVGLLHWPSPPSSSPSSSSSSSSPRRLSVGRHSDIGRRNFSGRAPILSATQTGDRDRDAGPQEFVSSKLDQDRTENATRLGSAATTHNTPHSRSQHIFAGHSVGRCRGSAKICATRRR